MLTAFSIVVIVLVVVVLVVLVIVAGFLAWFATAWHAMSRMTSRARLTNPDSPRNYELPFEDVSFPARDGLTIQGWFIPAADRTARRAVIFGHGHAGSMDPDLKYVPHFHRRGFHVLMFDFRGHGRSEGRYTSMGYFERRDMLGAVDYLERRGLGPLGVLGFSMGGVVAIGTAAECPAIRAVVSDGAFGRLLETIQQAARLDGLPGWAITVVMPLTAWLLRHRFHCSLSDADPIRWIGRISPRPVFIIHGEQDAYVSVDQARALYDAAGEPKVLWIAPGAPHRGVDDVYPEEYLARVLEFFERWLPEEQAPQVQTLPLGQWGTNCYVLADDGESIVVDPAADAERILDALAGTTVKAIVLTHGHPDHVEALDAVRQATGAPVGVHPADAVAFGIVGDFGLDDGDTLTVGRCALRVVHTPGHTPGSVCLRFDRRALVGDTLFPGGPGHSDSPEALAQLLDTLRERVFAWPDGVSFYPGHGDGSTIGQVRPAFEAFLARPRPPDLCGDVVWG